MTTRVQMIVTEEGKEPISYFDKEVDTFHLDSQSDFITYRFDAEVHPTYERIGGTVTVNLPPPPPEGPEHE